MPIDDDEAAPRLENPCSTLGKSHLIRNTVECVGDQYDIDLVWDQLGYVSSITFNPLTELCPRICNGLFRPRQHFRIKINRIDTGIEQRGHRYRKQPVSAA